jgi:proton-translocating NAD(P)+ transhydrogenase subunit alpha
MHGFANVRVRRTTAGLVGTMKVVVLKEIAAGEKRVAAVRPTVEKMAAAGIEVVVETGAGEAAGFGDAEYVAAGARVEKRPETMLGRGDAVLKVQAPAAPQELDRFPQGAVLIASTLQRRGDHFLQELARRRITAFSLDLLPRIARAQSMDVLSSMANVAGYKSVLLAANALARFFPMLMTAAGTVVPAKVFVVGAGVAGLQAVATARRLGAVVSAFDIRPAVKEQVESLGARFVAVGLEEHAEDAKGYAKEVSAETAQKERELLQRELAATDACITTALVPGKRAPILITAEMVRAMRPGSVIVDLAAEQGGNCELTEPGKESVQHGVTIIGPVNVASTMAYQASQLYSRNVLNFLLHVYDKQAKGIAVDRTDEIVKGCLVAHGGEVLQNG